jgi:hypothetical protein
LLRKQLPSNVEGIGVMRFPVENASFLKPKPHQLPSGFGIATRLIMMCTNRQRQFGIRIICPTF